MPYISNWITNLGLWPRFALTISLGFIVLFVTFAALGERALHDDTERLLDARLVLAQMAARQIDGLLQEAIFELEQAHRFADFDPVDSDLSIETDMLAQIYGQVGMFTPGITFLDPSGRAIISHPAALYPTGTNLATLPYISRALKQQQVTISDAFREPLNHQPVVAITVPIYKDNRLIGLLSGLVDLRGPAIVPLLQQSTVLGQTEHAALIDNQGRAVASTFDLPFLSPGEHYTFYRRAIAEGRPIVETVPFELDLPDEPADHLHVMALAPLQNAPWAVAVGGDQDETFAGVNRLRLGLALMGILALAIVWAVTLIGIQRLMHPIQHLTQAAWQIADGDLHTPLHAPVNGQIGVMASALERMRKQLLANIESLTLWNDTLEIQVAKQTEKLRRQQAITRHLLRRVITAQEKERAHLVRELHDGIGQMLTAIELSLERLAKTVPAENVSALDRLNRTKELIEKTIADLRCIIVALRPGVLDELGLVPVLDWLGDQMLRPLGLTVKIETDGLDERLPSEIETILFRISQEAMSNVARHSRATYLSIQLQHKAEQIILTLTDDGQGFSVSTVMLASDSGKGLGLASMRERASLAGGQMTINSAPGQGTTIQVVVPLPPVTESNPSSVDYSEPSIFVEISDGPKPKQALENHIPAKTVSTLNLKNH